ncbi:MAG: ammonia-forming cytochrome c nitrite reductase subunit c552 [Prolixibacteraceae bacterium]|jgi:tetratricopeptide (TPR) repeat protein|nr:ammonia-forming cytochrome c nitrite reductase subunit c552 [Prolixibacteraceae bacterium]
MTGKIFKVVIGCFIMLSMFSCKSRDSQQIVEDEFMWSKSCRECHERFYQLWEPSYHGQAMMSVNAEFIAKHKLPNSQPIDVEGHLFTVESKDSTMMMYERDGDTLIKTYDLIWAMGGHNVYCFLTPFNKGKLQNIPLAFDVNRKEWFNYPLAGVRHFEEEYPADEALPWKDAMFAFNTGCYSCHISQLSTNFDLESETYHTRWREAGINCETCHGPAGEHVRIFKNLKEGEEASKMGLIVTSTFTQEQNNDACAPCHAKMTPITPSYLPGDKYFDNYNITTLEDHDFYPDGRSLGENYTMTDWMQNPCVDKSELNCITCHTSSGRDRNQDNPNNSCTQCHTERIGKFEEHSGHKIESGLSCLSCHMPKREFVGRFLRSDHSFRPPMPEATMRFGSPNACNQCHTDKSPQWANKIVKKRENGNYQEETLKWAQLIKEAHDMQWKNIDQIFECIKNPKTDDVVANSLIRLLGNYNDESKIPVLLGALNNESELVRSSAATGLAGIQTEEVKDALLQACQDKIRLVRIQAASVLIAYSVERFTAEQRAILNKAEDEYVSSLSSRTDNWSNHYNLGIYHQDKGNVQSALISYETAARLYPNSVMPLINSSVLYSSIGDQLKAEENLKKVIRIDPENEAANLNLGLLLAEQGRMDEAENALKTVLVDKPDNHPVAAKNLSIIVAQRGDLHSAVKYATLAYKARPDAPDYGYTLAYYLMQNGQKAEAKKTLQQIIKSNPEYLTATIFLADIYLRDENKEMALKLYGDALRVQGLSVRDRANIQRLIDSLL